MKNYLSILFHLCSNFCFIYAFIIEVFIYLFIILNKKQPLILYLIRKGNRTRGL